MIRGPVNGTRVAAWATPPPPPVPPPQCPKRCDVATPPEPFGGGVFVCVCCGTEFRWPPKGPNR